MSESFLLKISLINCFYFVSLNLTKKYCFKDFKAQIQESVVFSILAERGVGPKLYAVFPGGRLEEYLPVSFRVQFSAYFSLMWFYG